MSITPAIILASYPWWLIEFVTLGSYYSLVSKQLIASIFYTLVTVIVILEGLINEHGDF